MGGLPNVITYTNFHFDAYFVTQLLNQIFFFFYMEANLSLQLLVTASVTPVLQNVTVILVQILVFGLQLIFNNVFREYYGYQIAHEVY